MRKVLIIIAALFVFIFGAQRIYAVDNDYKNNLLKIEVTELDSSHYDIGLYTQKIYNEPVKIIRKSDTIYYFLLPETSHAITSVTPVGAVKNVLVKTYPYSGQDMNNGYTKVAIITNKAVNLTTSLRTLDPSVSPRLDPTRLARLDNVFERYSERLAQNNIDSPLNDFRKTPVAQRPVIQSNVNVGTKVASANTSTKSFEDYQNKSNREQAAAKSVAASKAAAPVKQQTQNTAKAQTPVKQTAVSVPAKQQASAVQKNAQVAKNTQAVKTTAPAKQASVQTKPVSNPVKISTPAKQQTPVKQAESSAPVKQQAPVPQKIASASQPIAQVPAAKQAEKINTQNQPVKAEQQEQKQASVQETKQLSAQDKKAIEYEKQLAVKEPINATFTNEGEGVPAENAAPEKQIQVQVPIDQVELDEEDEDAPKVSNDMISWALLGFAFFVMLPAYIYVKMKNKKPVQLPASAPEGVPAARDVKELLRKTAAKAQEIKEDSQDIQEASYAEALVQDDLQTINRVSEEGLPAEDDGAEINKAVSNVEDIVPDEADEASIAQEPAFAENNNEYEYEDQTEAEKIEAFNSYMDSITPDEERSEVEINAQTPDDVAIEQLYTPFYQEPEEQAEYTSSETDLQGSEDDDVAQIVSSSKLTETRGLYLAKFEGETSLVGYIQDDIYVLYNFGEEEIKDTDIESSLAQENDTDSLYIVKTGGKKLMVKSTPYEMSLEMEM